MNNINEDAVIRSAILPCLGRACVAAIPYNADGGSLHLHFEKLVPRPKPLSNPHLPLELRSYMGETTILVQCEWRLTQLGKVIATSRGPTGQLLGLIERRLLSVVVASEAPYDLSLKFDNGISLDVFCNIACDSDADNYCVYAIASHVAYSAAEGIVIG